MIAFSGYMLSATQTPMDYFPPAAMILAGDLSLVSTSSVTNVTRVGNTKLVQCWSNSGDVGLALNQHYIAPQWDTVVVYLNDCLSVQLRLFVIHKYSRLSGSYQIQRWTLQDRVCVLELLHTDEQWRSLLDSAMSLFLIKNLPGKSINLYPTDHDYCRF